MPFEKWYPLMAAQNNQSFYYGYYSADIAQKGDGRSLDVLHISTALGTDRYSFAIPLNIALEKTCNTYLRLFRERPEASRTSRPSSRPWPRKMVGWGQPDGDRLQHQQLDRHHPERLHADIPQGRGGGLRQ